MKIPLKYVRILAAALVILILGGAYAWRQFKTSSPTSPPSPTSLTLTVDRGMSDVQLKTFTDRIADFEKQVADNEANGTRDVSVVLSLGNLYYEIGELGTAVTWYQNILDTNPNDPPALENMGQAQLEEGDFAGAEASWKHALNYEAYEPTYLKLVKLIIEHFPEQHDDVRVILENGVANLGQTPGLMTQLGEWYAAAGDYETAVSHYEVAKQLSPDDDTIVKRLAELRSLWTDSKTQLQTK